MTGRVTDYPFGRKEGLTLEFKRAGDHLPSGFFESVCAFLNLDGGTIILGVEDDGTISGVSPEAVERIKTDIANLSNNPQKLDPPYLLFPRDEEANGKRVITVTVPVSSQVHETAGAVYLRSEDGDYRVRGVNRLAGLLNRKLGIFTEQRVYRHLSMADLDSDLFDKARRLMVARMPRHPWANLSPEELLKVAGFMRRDPETGKPAYTLAAGLMFGSDATIQELVPGYKFDALLRRRDTERYDDRLIVRTNLIDAFELLMGFVEKHLNDPFYQEGTQSISLRTIIFRELVANIIAHREYTSVAPATMAIYADRVELTNPNVPHYFGRIDPSHFTPFPKNPTICKFMLQMGQYEELGSGVRRVNQYLPYYAPGAGKPVFEDGEMFRVIVPLAVTPEVTSEVTPEVAGDVTGEVAGDVTGEVVRFLQALAERPLTRTEAQRSLELRGQANFRDRYLTPALQAGLIVMTIPDKPRSRLQKYRLTARGQAVLLKSHSDRGR